ncbi:Crp/Fnr family transcriptional regulator [Flavobacterium lindanitolerans]|jgi:CRP-like cAMP-binding protein|uniref:Crp/Fnr family transcriptional regulator n=1 Tax=Flavobacterium lindanitolerans TaxID=428988 RepID=UPI0027BA752B|nr:cyclic nucleotide-binding domain-containing protein [Flavobacterium lindanitolerans]
MEELLFSYLDTIGEFSEEEKSSMMELIQLRTFNKGQIVLKAGNKTEDSFLVIKGCLRSYYIVDGEEKTTEFFEEEDIITPVCIGDNSPSRYNIACLEDTVLLVSNPTLEAAGFSRFPQFETLCRVLSERQLGKKQQEFDSFKISNPEERYKKLLMDRPQLVQRVPQYQIASYLGITPQSLSRLRTRIITQK